MTPWKIARTGDVYDRASGERIGAIRSVLAMLPARRHKYRSWRPVAYRLAGWEYLPPRCRRWRPAASRRGAAIALYERATVRPYVATRKTRFTDTPGGGVCRCLNPDSPVVCDDCPDHRKEAT